MEKDYPHQVVNRKIAETAKSVGLLWDPGSGKSKSTVEMIKDKFNERKAYLPTVIFTPLVTLYNWKNEFKLWS